MVSFKTTLWMLEYHKHISSLFERLVVAKTWGKNKYIISFSLKIWFFRNKCIKQVKIVGCCSMSHN